MPLGISARFHCDLELRGVVVFHLAVNEVPAPKHLLHDLIIKVSYVGIGEVKTTGFFCQFPLGKKCSLAVPIQKQQLLKIMSCCL